VIDSNATITGTFKVAMDTFTLAQGWQKCAILINNFGMARSKRYIDKVLNKRMVGRVLGNEPTISLNGEILSNGVDDPHSEFGGKEIFQKCNLAQNLTQKCNHNKEPSHRVFDGRLQDYE
jgi:hypothetical protein